MIITITRFANFGLMLVSPIVLVRFLSVEQFGVYREFLLYAGILTSIAAFNINNSLMYFIPAHRSSAWRFVHQSTVLVALNSAIVVLVVVLLDELIVGAIVGNHLMPLAAYTMFFVNVDFWEYVWLAQRHPGRVLAYTVARLALRLIVVVVAAVISGDVDTIIWWLVAFEGLRLLISLVAWRAVGSELGASHPGSWRQQIRSCVPLGTSLILMTLIRNAGSLFVTKLMGPVALAQFTVGTYVAPIVVVLRNSISDALLPEMSAQHAGAAERALLLWQRSTVVFAILLFPAAVLLARFAEPIIVTLFSADYRDAVPVFQLYALLLVRECVDFGLLIRSLDRNQLLVTGNIIALIVNLALLFVLVPLFGLSGAVLALLAARFSEGAYQLWRISAICQLPIGRLIPWRSLAVVAGAAAAAALPFIGGYLDSIGWVGVIVGSLAYLLVFALALWAVRVPEAEFLASRVRNWMAVRAA